MHNTGNLSTKMHNTQDLSGKMHNTGGLSTKIIPGVFVGKCIIPGVYPIFSQIPGGLSDLPLKIRGFIFILCIFPDESPVSLSKINHRILRGRSNKPRYYAFWYITPGMWTYSDDARLLRRVAPRCRAPQVTNSGFDALRLAAACP